MWNNYVKAPMWNNYVKAPMWNMSKHLCGIIMSKHLCGIIVLSRDYLFMSWLANHRALLSHTPRSHRSPPYCPTNKRVRYDRHQRKTKGIHMKKTDLLQEWLNDALGVHVTVIPGIQKGLQAFSFIHFQNQRRNLNVVWLGFADAIVQLIS